MILYITGTYETGTYRKSIFADMCSKLSIDILFDKDIVKGDYFSTMLAQLEKAHIVLINLDELFCEPIAVWQIGYALARGKSIIGLQINNQDRSPFNFFKETMFVASSLEMLEKALIEAK